MPKISDLETIKDEIYAIGNEKKTRAEWNESYNELPLPKDIEPKVNLENLKNTDNFNDAISSIDLDTKNLEEINLQDIPAPEVPENLLSKTDDATEDLNFGDEHSGFQDELQINDTIFDTTDFNNDETDNFPELENDNKNSFSDKIADNDITAENTPIDIPDLDESHFDLPTNDENFDEKFPTSFAQEVDDFDTDFTDSSYLKKDRLEDESHENNGSLNIDFSDEDFDTVPDLSSDMKSLGSDSFDEKNASLENIDNITKPDIKETEEDPYKSVESVEGVQVPEIDEKTGFAKKEDDAHDVVFTPPEKFQDFSDEQGKAFVTPKNQDLSTEDMAGNIPLAISEKDFQKFLTRLSKMPLNLRKEIQKYIAFDDDLEENKMELVDLIIKDAPIKKIVRYLEDNLKKTIKIPKGFDKKSVEELARERKTLKYRLQHQVLPLLTIAGLLTLLICSIAVLGWHFVYKPIMSESYYNKGFRFIQSGKNTTAIEAFDKAGTYWKKKRWYFRYAKEFRKKKQYSSAELIYLRLLTDFNHDAKGGIEYANMLSVDLRDYQRAETVLRRQVLDYHPQSAEAFYALANLYLDWGLEDANKLEEGYKIFTSLISKFGNSDLYSAGLMKYYIRTANIEKVLPYKDYFLGKNRKILQVDLNELGGFLLDCLYEPSFRITLEQKEKISDVREVLEKAHKLNDLNPEANYNLGRFFVYNYKEQEASYYLKKAIDNYGDEILPLVHFFKKLDAMRLYGDVLVKRSQYLEAETVFASALNLYRTYSAVTQLPENKNVGKLFEAYGDIKYFIANDYTMALESYTTATKQLADSPKIRYKMGYINYQLQNYDVACTEFGRAYAKESNDTNLLFSLANSLFKRADYQLAQAYYERLMENLDAEKFRRKVILPQIREHDTVFVENYMKATNNLAVTLNRLAVQHGNSEMNSRSFTLFAESTRAWDALTRNPKTLIRIKNQQAPAYVNVQYMSVPNKNFVPEIYTDIPKTLENELVLSQTR